MRGGTATIATPDAGDVDKVVLIRNTAQTHLIDGDARTVELEFTASGSALNAAIPASGDVLPAGPYLLFVLRDGVPSVAAQVSIG